MKQRVLTGITTTGTPHLGNYAGAIRPAVDASQLADVDGFFFLADLHALIKCDDAQRIERSRMEVAATWLAAGLDPEKATFYRQSDVPEILELYWLLTCVASKGLLNRAHAFKAAIDRNEAAGNDPEAGITLGLFSYPVLMAADILMFNADIIPVGRDQVQHVELAKDIGQRFNHLFSRGDRPFFKMPNARVDESVAILPGLDGRKMSKSYDNTIPLFCSKADLRKAVMSIVTDSRLPGEPKDTDGCALVEFFKAFASPEHALQFENDLVDGLGWGEAKHRLLTLLEDHLSPKREVYESLMRAPDHLEEVLQAGAEKARKVAAPFLQELRAAVGLGSLVKASSPTKSKSSKAKALSFRSYLEEDSFFFKCIDANGETLLQSIAFKDAKAMGASLRVLANGQHEGLIAEGDALRFKIEGRVVAERMFENPHLARAALRMLERHIAPHDPEPQ